MVTLNPYLNFNGKCREAMTFYKNCLGGDLYLQKVSESPMAAQLPSEAGINILHSMLTSEKIVLMASDMIGRSLVHGNDISLCLTCNDDEQVNEYFTRLGEGGSVRMPLHQTFWGATYGELTDKFGINWLLTYRKGMQ